MKKSFYVLRNFALVFSAVVALTGCDPKTSEDNRSVRELDTSFVDVWQGGGTALYILN